MRNISTQYHSGLTDTLSRHWVILFSSESRFMAETKRMNNMKMKHLFSAGLAGTLLLMTQTTRADQVWLQRYDGPGHSNDVANAVTVDGAGNVAVTGGSQNANGDYDYYTAKYAPDGTLLWEHRHDGPSHGDDLATAVAVDGVGNVIVTGYSFDVAGYPNLCWGNSQFYTAKYDAADGHLLWEHPGPDRGGFCLVLESTIFVAVDNNGDIIVSGTALVPTAGYYAAKYAAADGHLVWEARYTPSDWHEAVVSGAALDSAGNVIVTGGSYSGPPPYDEDFYTVKYAATDGHVLWDVLHSEGPGHIREHSTGVVADKDGNVIITGLSYDYYAPNPSLVSYYYTAKYAAADGQLLWEQRYQTPVWGPAVVAVDGIGNVGIAAASPPNLGNPLAFAFAAKYAAGDGHQLWLEPYQSCDPGGDYPFGIAFNQGGDLIVTGIGYDGDWVGYVHYHTVRYAGADGQVLWQQNYIGPGNLTHGRDTAQALAMDKDGNVIVTGYSQNSAGNYDYLTLKYLPSGTSSSTLTCPADIVVGNDPGQCSAVVAYTLPTAIDACGNTLTVTGSPAPGSVSPKGTTTVTLSAPDGTRCSFNITVNDTQPPAITCPANIAIGCAVDLLVPVSFAATATDNCGTPTLTYSVPPGSGFPVGTTPVTCTATDSSGNQSSCSFTVTRAPLDFTGFLPPISGADATGGSFASPLRTFKLSSTIPVKFTAACSGSPVLSGIHRLQVIKYSAQTTAGDPIDATPTDAATTGDQFRLTDSQWQFNLDTKATGMRAGIWLLRATLSDGSQHSVWIQIK